MEGDQEYGFWHVLVRDVCYSQIPRAARGAGHLAAADWIQRKAGDRVEDLADVLAHHYLMALELTGAAGRSDESGELAAQAIRYLVSQVNGLSRSMSRAQKLSSRVHSSSHPAATRSGPTCSSAGAGGAAARPLPRGENGIGRGARTEPRARRAVPAGRTLTTLNVVLPPPRRRRARNR